MNGHIHHKEFGKGEPLVLLFSLGLTSYSYESCARKLAKKYRVIVPDLYRGRSRHDTNASTLDDYVEALHAFLHDVPLKRYNLIGFSFGGLIASEYLFRYPEELQKVMLVSTYPPLSQEKPTVISGMQGYMKLLYHNMYSRKGMQVNRLWFKDSLFNLFLPHPKQFFMDPIIATKKRTKKKGMIPVRTKILAATNDEFISYDQYQSMKLVENLELETVDGYHAWFFLDEALLVKKIIEYLG